MSQSRTIVIADADEEVRLALSEATLAVDPTVTVVEVSNGRELAATFTRDGIDILFVDVALPLTNGADIVDWYGAIGRKSLIVLVSDLLAPGWPNVAKKIGAYDVILKPLNETHIRRVIEASRILSRKLSVLIADSGSETRSVIKRLLQRSNFSFDIREAESGQAAVGLVRRQAFELAIVAMELSDHPGLEVACRIDDLRPGTKIVMTGRDIEPAMEKQLGTFAISCFLRKPFGYAEIDRMLHEVFGLWRPYLITALQNEERRLLGVTEDQSARLVGSAA